MPFKRYLGEGKIELLKCKMELLTSIQLKRLPCWLTSKDQLRKQQETGNKQIRHCYYNQGRNRSKKAICNRPMFWWPD